MKNVLMIFVCSFALFFNASAQQQQAPQLLKEPSAWQFERFTLPPGFAPGFPYKGAEELRFSPGMFIKDSSTYFTYAFVAELDNIQTISQDDIKNYLLEYFKGLCSATAKDRKLVVDTSKINVSIEKKNNIPNNQTIYNATLNVLGVFTDGLPVKLNMEIKVLKSNNTKKIYLVFIASPLAKTDEAWLQLYKIQKDFTIPVQ